MLVERRRAAFTINFLVRLGLAWLAVSAMLVAINWSAIAALRFPDPDDTMRLIQVRDLLGGQAWFDLSQHRVDASGGGVPMHWSRLVDIPLALAILLLTPILGPENAETAALVIVPLITLGLSMMLAARIAWRLLGDEEAILTSLVLAISVPVLFQLGPLRIDHHGWQIVCALAAVNGLMARSPVLGGRIIGASLATWLAISLEGLPLAAIIFAVIAVRWLRHRDARVMMVGAIQSLALVSLALFLLTRGIDDLALYCDAISPVHLAMFLWGAVVLTLFAKFEPMPRGILLFGIAIAGGGALAGLLMAAPQCASGGGFSALDPIVAKYWHANVLEGMPIWRQSLSTALQYAVTPLIALVAAIALAARSRDWLRQFWFDYAVILAGAFVVSIFVSRAGAVACVLAAPPLAWQLRQWLRAIRTMEQPAPRMVAMIGVVCALLPAFPAILLANAMPARASLGGVPDVAVKAVDCRMQDAGPVLAELPKGEFFAPMDIAPELLLTTDHTVIATGHHRGNAGMRVLMETALGSPDEAKAALAKRGTAYVALCPALGEARMYAKIAPEGFVADLIDGQAPGWLEPVALDQGNGLKVWRIRPE
ncbi:hypothetical protein [Erythrobacter aurantius]|uniref:hypothetical protein n=1 Tax=Erythrobacter aurantius TaxID=2909249 RepID=UPI00207AA7AE|nr:hypothetical protein [Erythrobacter aurantius]